MSASNRPHAAIDIGTNSMHLVVAELGEAGGLNILTTDRALTRLGQDAGPNGEIQPEAIKRGLEALGRFVEISRGFSAEISAVATSAIREASNKDEFLDAALEEFGLRVDIIRGVEEARLIHSGVVQSLDIYDKHSLIFDIGGGSTEFILSNNGKIKLARSLKLGAIRLTDMFFPGGVVTPDSLDAAQKYIRSSLAPMRSLVADYRVDFTVGCSGTIEAVAHSAAYLQKDSIRQINGTTFDLFDVEQIVEKVAALDPPERCSALSLEPKRQDIIAGGAVLLLEIMRSFKLEEAAVSAFALREGVLYDRLLRPADTATDNLRVESARQLAHRLDSDPEHAERVSELAINLFDETILLHKLKPEDRELLQVAAIAHNVGVAVSYSAHHKHSYYIIRNSEYLNGFTERQLEIVASIARFHRKALPSKNYREYSQLSSEDRNVVSVLAGILRVAIGLDRRHLGVIASIAVDASQEGVAIVPVSEEDVSLEIYDANSRSELLAAALGVPVVVKPAP